MRKRFLIVAALTATIGAHAQWSFGLQAGYDLITEHSRGVEKGNLNLNGFHVGPTATYQFRTVEGLGIGGAIYYQFGVANTESQVHESLGSLLKDVHAFHYSHAMQVPVRLSYNVDLGRKCGLFIFGGPTLNVGIWQGDKFSYRDELNRYVEVSWDYYSGKAETENYDAKTSGQGELGKVMTRCDLLLGAGMGFRIQNLYLSANYDWGLLNRYSKDYRDAYKTLFDKKPRWHTRQLQVSLGYSF